MLIDQKIVFLLLVNHVYNSWEVSPDYYYMHKQFLPRIQRRVIVDTDPGIDDYQALAMLIDSDNKGFIKIEAIIVSEGNTAQNLGLRNTIRLLEAADRLDIPVYKGSRHPLLPHKNVEENFFGKDGFGDLNWRKEPPVFLVKNNFLGPHVIQDLVGRYPKEITVITLGPLTNLALALRMYETVAQNIKEVYSMGGLSRDGIPEFNISFDPESAEIVLSTVQCPMYLFTWQGCNKNIPKRIWFENATIFNPVYNIMLASEKSLSRLINTDDWESCDAATVSIFLDRNIVLKEHSAPLKVNLDQGAYRGLIEEENTQNTSRPLVTVIDEINYDRMQRIFLESFHDICYYHNCQKIY